MSVLEDVIMGGWDLDSVKEEILYRFDKKDSIHDGTICTLFSKEICQWTGHSLSKLHYFAAPPQFFTRVFKQDLKGLSLDKKYRIKINPISDPCWVGKNIEIIQYIDKQKRNSLNYYDKKIICNIAGLAHNPYYVLISNIEEIVDNSTVKENVKYISTVPVFKINKASITQSHIDGGPNDDMTSKHYKHKKSKIDSVDLLRDKYFVEQFKRAELETKLYFTNRKSSLQEITGDFVTRLRRNLSGHPRVSELGFLFSVDNWNAALGHKRRNYYNKEIEDIKMIDFLQGLNNTDILEKDTLKNNLSDLQRLVTCMDQLNSKVESPVNNISKIMEEMSV